MHVPAKLSPPKMPDENGTRCRMKSPSKVFPVVFAVLVAVITVAILWRAVVVAPTGPGNSPDKQTVVDYNRCLTIASASGTLDAKVLQKCGEELIQSSTADDSTRARLDELRWMLTIIGSLAAFFAIAQAASAFFAAQSYTGTADAAIARIKEQEASVRARYPLFEEVERGRDEAYKDLAQAIRCASKVEDPDADPLEALVFLGEFYKTMPVEKRQRLLSVESFASIDLDEGPMGEQGYAADLVRLALFYQSKFSYENSLQRGCVADLERAEIYLRKAYEKSASDFTIRNDLSLLYITLHREFGQKGKVHLVDAPYLRKAKEEIDDSLWLRPSQQRAYYNLAVIEGRYLEEFPAAMDHLKDALKHPNWQNLPVTYTRALIHYNLGCYAGKDLASRLASITGTDAAQCLEALTEAAKYHCIPAKIVKEDFELATGDLHVAYEKADAELKLSLTAAKDALLTAGPATPPPNKDFWKALREAWKIVRPTLQG